MSKLPQLLIQTMTASLQRGGVEAQCFVQGDTNLVKKGDAVVLRAKSLAGFRDADERIIYNGWVLSDPTPITFDKYASRVTVKLGQSHSMLRGESIQPIGFSEQASPANSHQIIPPMKISDIVWHCMQYHCNHVKTTDNPNGIIEQWNIDTSGSTQRQTFVIQASDNFWGKMQTIGGGEKSGEFFRPWLDRTNTFYYQKSPHFWTTPPTSKGTLDAGLMLGQPNIIIRNSLPEQRVGQVEIRTTGYFKDPIYGAVYPASPFPGKIVKTLRGIWASSQADTNQKAQNLYRWLTRPYTLNVEVDAGLLFFGDDGQGLKLADAVQVVYNGPANDNGFHLNLNHKFYVYGYKVNVDWVRQTAKANIILEADN